jgi:hypothetical protein
MSEGGGTGREGCETGAGGDSEGVEEAVTCS